MLHNRKKALFPIVLPPKNATEQQWQEYTRKNQNWLIKYFLIVYLEIALIMGLAYLLDIFIFSKY